MDARTAAILAGYTALLSELARLLVSKHIATAEEIRELATGVVERSSESGAAEGTQAPAMHLLKIMEGWQPKKPLSS